MDLLTVCRVCMAEKLEYFYISETSYDGIQTFAEILSEISSFSISDEDSLSKNICSTCRDFCNEFLKFRETIHSSHEFMQAQILVREDELKITSEMELIVEEFEDTEEEIEDGTIAMEVLDEEESEDEDIEGEMTCEKCDKTFNKEEKLVEHMRTHSPRTRMFSCQTCKRKFTTEILLQHHEIIHSDLITQIKPESKNSCIVCGGKGFKSRTELENHTKEHKELAETESINCPHCEKRFSKLNNLLRHLRSHEENKTHSCNVCFKTFAMGQELIDHLNRHKGFTPHTCHICSKSYMQISKLKNHMKTHSDLKVRKVSKF